MRRFLNLIISLGGTLIVNTFCTAQPALPPGPGQALFAWYEALDFQNNTQTWPARFGGVTLNSETLDGSKAELFIPYEREPYIEMKGVGFRAELLPSDANASYTVFAVANRITRSSQNVYNEMTWGMGRSSAHPGVALETSYSNTPTPRFYFSPSRSETSGHIGGAENQITSLTFSYGVAQSHLGKIASINGLSKVMDEGNILVKSHNWVYLNCNASFAPRGAEQHHRFSEFIIYNRRLTEEERHQVETYLSLKYTVPLVLGKPNGAVLTLDGTTMLWDTTRKFNHHVLGIGKYNSALIRSTAGRQNSLWLTLPENPVGFTNEGWILIGENKDSYPLVFNPPTVPLAGGGVRHHHVWRAQNTGLTQKIRVMFPSTSIQGGGMSLDPCAPQRLIISSDSTFQTYTAYPLTPDIFYGNPEPPYFSRYIVDVNFPLDESFVTIANVDSFGTPHIPDEDAGLLSLKPCENEDGFLHFTDPLGHPTVAIRGLPYETLTKGLSSASIQVLEEPVAYSGSNKQAALMRRMLTLTSNLGAFPNPVTVRYYLPDSDLTDTDQLGGSNRTWYKRNGDAKQFLNDFLDDGSIDPNESIIVTPVYGTSEGVPYVEFQNLTSFSTIGMISTDGSLPVRLADFRAIHEGSSTLLQWRTTAEHDFSHFSIERSADAKSWMETGTIPGYNIGGSYSFIDASPLPGLSYYRLKMVDNDSSSEYSNVVSIEHKAADWMIHPNPATTRITLNKGGNNSGVSIISVTDSFGIPRIQLLKPTPETIDVSRLNPGIYQLKISFEDGTSQSKKLVVAPR